MSEGRRLLESLLRKLKRHGKHKSLQDYLKQTLQQYRKRKR